jgi:hypothetical protein
MRLVEICIRNFRGFGGTATPIRLDRDLVLIFGHNGFGKTSLAEAVEWLFYDRTKRRLLGETYSKSEYAGTYANVHGGRPVQVDAIVEISGREHRITRRLIDGDRGETSEFIIDGVTASLASIGIVPVEAEYPVVAQHGLQTFIHTKPKDRRDAIGAALGLDELTALKSALDGARTSFQRTPPEAVVLARSELVANVAGLGRVASLAPLVQRWRKTPLQVERGDVAALIAAAAGLTGIAVGDAGEALIALRNARGEASKAVFDAATLAPPASMDRDLQSLAASGGKVSELQDAAEKAVAAAVAAAAATYSTALLEFWKRGLALSAEGVACPMCEVPTLTRERRVELSRRITAGMAAIASGGALTQAIAKATGALAELKVAAANCVPLGMNDSERGLLCRLMGGAAADLAGRAACARPAWRRRAWCLRRG